MSLSNFILLSSFISQCLPCAWAQSAWGSGWNTSKEFRYDYVLSDEVNGWFKLHDVPAKWHAARTRCTLEGAELASPQNERMLRAMIQTMSSRMINKVFTGIHSTFSYGNYFSIKGVPLDWMPLSWAVDGPSADNDKRSVVLFNNGTIINDFYNKVSYPYICFKKYKGETLTVCGTIDKGYQYVNELDTCYKFHTNRKSWYDAFATCAAEGAHLAIPNTDKEHQSIIELFKNIKDDYAHVGINLWEKTGPWVTIHGDTLKEAGFSTWAPGEPNNPKTEFCGTLRRSGGLDDTHCDVKLGFICEKKRNSLAIIN